MKEEENSTLLNRGEGVGDFTKELIIESKKIWYLAAPVICTSFCQYSLTTITQIFAGHLGTLQLAALTMENSIIAGIPFGMMFGFASALETYCGQAFGANQIQLLGVYMQKSWLILNAIAIAAVPFFVFATQFLRFVAQTTDISRATGNFALWMIPQQFAYAMMLPSTKFLQAQSKVMVLALIAVFTLCFHAFFCWFFITYLRWGMVGAALVLDASWWFTAIAQFLYITTGSGSCGQAWSGFSSKAFQDFWSFFRISAASAIMMCLEVWYISFLTLFAGYAEDAEVAIDAFSICINIVGWTYMVSIGLNVASSVRVSNELGSMQPRKARFSAIVSGVSALLIGLFFALILMISRKHYPAIFTNSSQVQHLVDQLTPLLGICIVLTNIQYTLCGIRFKSSIPTTPQLLTKDAIAGVAIGAGWQAVVSYMSIGCYIVLGVPLGVLMAYKFEMGIKGLWCGMLLGSSSLTGLLLWMMLKTNWQKESYAAETRLKEWMGEAVIEETTSRDRH